MQYGKMNGKKVAIYCGCDREWNGETDSCYGDSICPICHFFPWVLNKNYTPYSGMKRRPICLPLTRSTES
jgi:hypothetical protein